MLSIILLCICNRCFVRFWLHLAILYLFDWDVSSAREWTHKQVVWKSSNWKDVKFICFIRHFYFDISFNTKRKPVGALPGLKIIMRSYKTWHKLLTEWLWWMCMLSEWSVSIQQRALDEYKWNIKTIGKIIEIREWVRFWKLLLTMAAVQFKMNELFLSVLLLRYCSGISVFVS